MEDFVNFIKREVLLCINDSEYLHDNYNIDYKKEGDFIKTADVIIGNLDGTLNKANLEGIQVKKGENIGGNSVFYENKEKLLYVIYRLSNYYDIDYVHPIIEHSWGQRVVRLYDPDKHIIEVGENMKTVCKRFLDSGMTPEQVAKRMDVPLKFVNGCMR